MKKKLIVLIFMLQTIFCTFGTENNLVYVGDLAFANMDYTKIEDIIMIPLRFMFQIMGCDVVWVGDSIKDDILAETTVPSKSGIETKLLKIYLSPSKQPYNSYVVGNTNEQAEMEDLASRITVMLNKDYECEAILATLSLSRHEDGRPLEAKNKECDVYIGLHSNATGGGEGTASGAIGFYHPDNPTGKVLATNIVNEINNIDPVKSNRPSQLVNGMSMFDGVGLAEVKHPSNYGMISVLMETEFHDNPITANWILTHKYVIARAYVNGIVNTFNISEK